MENRDSARMGKAVEHLVAATCILTSGFELNVSTSLVDDESVDLVFHRRDRATTLAVQVKSRSMRARTIANRSRFIATIGASTFQPREDLHLLFVAVDTGDGTITKLWLVPSIDFDAMTRPNSKSKHRFSASVKDSSKDQWSAYRLERTDLADRILNVLDALAAPQHR
jgi:hypothetical protein